MNCSPYFLAIVTAVSCLQADITPSDPGWPEAYPSWWYDADLAKSMIDVSSLDDPGNQSAILQGQLLHMADMGIQELNERLGPVGGAGFDISVFTDLTEVPSYYSPAVVGQLKYVTSYFYDRFADVGFQPGSVGWNPAIVLDNGVGDNSPLYPWSEDQTLSNLGVGIIGQAKYLFSWDIEPWISDVMEDDFDNDGLPDFWENYWFPGQNLNPFEDLDGDLVLNIDEFNNTTAPNSNASLDGDPIPDDWEVFHGLDISPGADNSSSDSEPDGLNLQNEFLNGTNPNLKDHPALDLYLF